MSGPKKKKIANLHLKLMEAVNSNNLKKVEKVVNAEGFLAEYIVHPLKLNGRNKTPLHLAFEVGNQDIQLVLIRKYKYTQAFQPVKDWFKKVNTVFHNPEIQDSFFLAVLGVVVASMLTAFMAPWLAYRWHKNGGKAQDRCNQVKQEVETKKVTGRKQQPLRSCLLRAFFGSFDDKITKKANY